MAASTVTYESSSPMPSPSLETKRGGRKSKKFITIDLSSISCVLKIRDDTINTINTTNIANIYNIKQDDGKEEKDECCIEYSCLNNNTNIEADTVVDAETEVDTEVETGKNGYYYRNRERKLEYQKNYNREQGDKIKNYNKDYYQKKRDEILEKAKTKIICECGCEVQLFNMNSHKKTKKHAKALLAISEKI
jgi:hypothetical protein